MKTTILLLVVLAQIARGQSIISPPPPAFSLSREKTRTLLQNVIALKKGDSFKTITNALGTPNVDEALGGGFIAHVLKYDVLVQNREPFGQLVRKESVDDFVKISLGPDDRIVFVQIKAVLYLLP